MAPSYSVRPFVSPIDAGIPRYIPIQPPYELKPFEVRTSNIELSTSPCPAANAGASGCIDPKTLRHDPQVWVYRFRVECVYM